MTKLQILGRTLLTLSLALTVILGIVIDWTVSHWVDPHWTPHARYHLLLYHGTLSMLGAGALWGLWGSPRRSAWSARIAYFVIVAVWLPFYPAALVESVTPLAVPEDVIMGLPANLVVGTVHLIVATIGFLLARGKSTVGGS